MDSYKLRGQHSSDGVKGLPQMAELTEQFIIQAGGPAAIAAMLLEDYRSAEPGSATRSRIMDLFLRCWRTSTEDGADMEDMGLLTDEDLDSMLQSMMQAHDGERDGAKAEDVR
jgi:hypothetical protein